MKSNLGKILLLTGLVVAFLAVSRPVLFTYLLIAGIRIAVLIALAIVIYVVYRHVRNRLSPAVRVRARVVRRSFTPWDVTLKGETTEMGLARLGTMGRDHEEAAEAWSRSAEASDVPEIELAGGVDYYVTFAVGDREVEFAVPEDAYVEAEEGTEGPLVFRGEQFERYIPRTGGADSQDHSPHA